MFRTVLLTGAALALSACASIGNLAAVNKKETLGSGFNGKAPAGVFIDAEQRAVLSNRRAGSDLRVVCAEPAPDALSAIAAQAGVSVSDISNAVSAEGGVSEAAANIGLRTQTIQTLRDGFYRVCEAYMNGLSEEQYSIMLRRFQTNMIALLAIEQLTGAVKGGDAVVSASAGSGIDFREQYLQRAAMASSEQSRLATDISQTNEDIGILEDVNAQCEQGGFGDGCSAADVERRGREIRDLRAQRRAMERAQASAESTERTNNLLAESAPSATDSSAGGMTGSWPSTPAYPPSYAVAEAVRDITMAIVQNDYGVQLCFEHLRYIQEGDQTALSERCEKVMDAYVQQLTDANAMRVEMQRAQAALMESVASGYISADEASSFAASLSSSAAAPAPTTARSLSPFNGPVAAAGAPATLAPPPPPPPPTRQ
jgi:hypothetical protein